jgi:RNA polymerase sigma-70 factor (ECF subfamily)
MRIAPAIEASGAAEGARTDGVLLSEYARGDADALGELYDRHHGAVYRFLFRLTGGSAADLDDLAQATFVEVARSAARFDGRSAVTTWLFGIAVNVVRHHRRGIARSRRVIAEPGEDRPSDVPGVDRPDDNAERRQLLSRVRTAIDHLSDELREVFVACEIEDLPGKDVARTLRIPEGTLWRRLHEARKRVREAALGGTP